jgi:autoinducer 2-degrading protein
MHVTIVNVTVKPGCDEKFLAATRDNHEGSIEEEGNLAFDVLQMPEDPCQFVLYESYVSAAAAQRHKDTPHYKVWRDAVAEWMAEPRSGTTYVGVFPEVYEEV